MPKLVQLYITHVTIGFGLAAVFVALLVGFDIAGLGHLVLASDAGWLAALMLWVSNGIIFAAVQFGIAVMRLAEADDTPRGGLRQGLVPVPVRVAAAVKPGTARRR